MISRERIEQAKLTRDVTKRAFGGETSATGRIIDDLLAALDEREELLAGLRQRFILLHQHGIARKENCAGCLEIWEAADLLRGGRFEVKP